MLEIIFPISGLLTGDEELVRDEKFDSSFMLYFFRKELMVIAGDEFRED